MAKKPSREIIKLQNQTGVSKQVAIETLKNKNTITIGPDVDGKGQNAGKGQ